MSPGFNAIDTNKFIRRLHEMGVYNDVIRLIRPRGVSVGDLVLRNRQKNVSAARHEIMYWIRMKMKWSYSEIGKLFERDHTTVIGACRKVHAENPAFGGASPSIRIRREQSSETSYDVSEWIIR